MLVLISLIFVILGASVLIRFVIVKGLAKVLPTGALFLGSITGMFALIGGFYVLAKWANVEPTLILAVIAIVTAGISLSADTSFQELFAGAKIVTSGRFSVGEYVTVAGGTHGLVKEVGPFSVVIQSNSKGIVTLSNRDVADQSLINHSRLSGVEMSITFPMYDSHDIVAAANTIKEVAAKQPGILPNPKVFFEWIDNGMTYALVFKVIDFTKRREVSSELASKITEDLTELKFPLGSVVFQKQV